jgi:hypothetical protein
MAFVLKDSDSFSWPIIYRQPVSGGRKERQEFEAEFKRLPQSRISEIQEQVQAKVDKTNQDIEISDVSIADEILVGWSSIIDVDGEEIPFSKTTKAQLLELPLMASCLIEAYFSSLVEEKRKN